ncbi:unnamed protein product [Strongylus vulgaris]|uniref:Uncharacterized protein n=1 Tax=Strongylus vulgaris TaxID=40348 RepID=A0A3P7M1G8_STRVU|nr:unnamed protein product [Strongylus vulgaris]
MAWPSDHDEIVEEAKHSQKRRGRATPNDGDDEDEDEGEEEDVVGVGAGWPHEHVLPPYTAAAAATTARSPHSSGCVSAA